MGGMGLEVGVHEGTMVKRSVTVGVGVHDAGFTVGGGNGLRLLLGLTKIMVTAETTQQIETSDRIVRMFHTMLPVFLRLGGSFISDMSYVSMLHFPNDPLWHQDLNLAILPSLADPIL